MSHLEIKPINNVAVFRTDTKLPRLVTKSRPELTGPWNACSTVTSRKLSQAKILYNGLKMVICMNEMVIKKSLMAALFNPFRRASG